MEKSEDEQNAEPMAWGIVKELKLQDRPDAADLRDRLAKAIATVTRVAKRLR